MEENYNDYNNYNNNVNYPKRKKPILSIVSLTILAIMVLVGTYAFWQVTRKQTNRNLVGAACLSISFSNETGDLDLQNMWPTTDSDGAALTPYTFTLTNNCPDALVSYTVALEEIKDDSADPITYPDDYISDSNIKIKFDNVAPVKVGTLDTLPNDTEEDYEIYGTKKLVNRKLAGGESRTHSIRMWLDANTPQSEMNKFFLSKVKIIAGQGIEEECYAVNNEGLLYSYDPDCGTSATIPATVDGKQVQTIGANAFKGDRQKRISIYHDELLEKEEDDTVPSINDFGVLKNNRCKNRSNTSVNCTIDYSVALSERIYGVFYDESFMENLFIEQGWDPEDPDSEQLLYQYIAENYGPDDIYFVIYDTGNDTDRINFIRNRGVSTLTEAYGMFDNIDQSIINSHIISSANPIVENYYEDYNATTWDNNGSKWIKYDYGIGTKEPTNQYTSEYGLLISSLDLSQATNLNAIESRAFSMAPDLNGISEWPNFADYPGLTSLTFGNNTREIQIGGAAFSGANLDNLTIYTSHVYPNYDEVKYTNISTNPDKTGAYAFMGPYVGSTINNLTITGVSGYPTYADIANFTIDNDPYDSINLLGYALVAGQFYGYYASTVTFTGNISTINNVTNLTYDYNLTLPSSLTTIGDYAFFTYSGDSLTLPNGLTTIGYDALSNYHGANFTIPASVTRIKQGAFGQFKNTVTVNNSQGNVNFDNGWVHNNATVNWN